MTYQIIEPEATINLCTNPSFETGTHDWTTGGSNTLAQSDTVQWAGSYSLQATYQNNATLASFAVTLSTSTTYRLTARVYVPSNWDGGNIALSSANYTSSTTTTVSQFTAGTDDTGAWHLLETSLVVAGDGSGSVTLVTSSNPTAGRVVYLDAVQIEQKTGYRTTYCDGDQPGCVWTDKPHDSTSSRPVTTRAGGRLRDLRQDYDLTISSEMGTGMAPVSNIYSSRSLLPGSEFQRSTVGNRTFVLNAAIVGTSTADLHARRQALLRLVAPDSVPDEQPVVFRYTGAAVTKRLTARYDSGLEMRGPDVYSEKIAWRFISNNPFWQSEAETAVSLGPTSATMRLILGRVGGEWTVFGPPHASGTYTAIVAIAAASPNEIYVAGKFANFDNDSAADSIVMWDGDSWEPVGSPQLLSNNDVLALALDTAGNLYLAGTFENIGAVAAADYIASWDGSNYAALGTPSSGATITGVYAIAIDPLTGDVWVGGDFDNLAGVAAADNIAYYDVSDSAWKAAGASGANDVVYALTFAPDGMLFVGGAFTSIGGVSGNRFARRNPTGGWSTMGSGFASGETLTIALSPAGAIYAGGTWSSQSYVARWTQNRWTPLGGGTDGNVRKLLFMPDGSLIALGAFTEAGGNALADGLAVWNEGAWSPFPVDLPGSVAEGTLARQGDNLFVGTDQSGTVYMPGTAVTATNGGTARAYPIIEASNASGGDPAVLESIENITTGKRLLFRPGFTILQNQTLRLDLRPGRRSATLGTTTASGDGKDSGEPTPWPLAPNSDVAEFFLLPGDNELVAYASPATAPDLTIHVRWRDAFWSVD